MSKEIKPIAGSQPLHNPLIVMTDPLYGITKEVLDQARPAIKPKPQDLGVFITGTSGMIFTDDPKIP